MVLCIIYCMARPLDCAHALFIVHRFVPIATFHPLLQKGAFKLWAVKRATYLDMAVTGNLGPVPGSYLKWCQRQWLEFPLFGQAKQGQRLLMGGAMLPHPGHF